MEIEECPEIKNIIRADTIISGYLLTKLNETDCILDLVYTVDIKVI